MILRDKGYKAHSHEAKHAERNVITYYQRLVSYKKLKATNDRKREKDNAVTNVINALQSISRLKIFPEPEWSQSLN